MSAKARIAVRGVLIAACVAALVSIPASAALATTATPPHVPMGQDTDVCAMCHRTHLAASTATHPSAFDSATAMGSLLAAVGARADTDMCFVCHGVEALGSGTDVQTSFSTTSTHSLWPAPSLYGPSPKQCGSCHDTHGSERISSDTPYPALLRARTTTNSWTYTGDDYCGACHLDRADDLWSGIGIWRQTAHARLTTPTGSGTGIRCSICHEPHGSGLPPLIRRRLYPPTVAATATVTANDRTLCLACHSGASATYSGSASYSVSSHGSSSATWAATGEWASRLSAGSAETSRKAGECANCHAPMGAKDASGSIIPKNVRAVGRAVCDPCHDADGPARSNIASLAPTAAEATAPELVSVWRPRLVSPVFARVGVYSRDSSGTVPRPLVGPREYAVPAYTGDAAAADIDGDGYVDLIVADASAPRLNVFSRDALRGLTRFSGPGTLSLPFSADFVAAGDFLADGTGLPEVAVIDTATAALYVYRLSGSSLVTVAGPLAPGTLPGGVASGDVTGSAAADLVVTDRTGDRIYIYHESGGALVTAGPYPTRQGPVGPSVGDAWAGGSKAEIAIANAEETAGMLTIMNGSGTQLGSYDATGFAGAIAYDTVIADCLPGTTPVGTSGAEVAVALYSVTSTTATGINVFPQVGAGGLDAAARQTYASNDSLGSGSLAAGDLDGDGRTETLVGNAGRWLGAGSPYTLSGASSVQVYRPDAAGTALATSSRRTLFAGGGEFGGGAPPALVVADLGPVGATRHPVSAISGTHVSTEAAGAPRHVECPDCHNPHEATSVPAPGAPLVGGRLRGARGVTVTNVSTTSITFGVRASVLNEYEVCLKCHSSYATAGATRDIASEVNTENPGEHAIEASSTDANAQSGTYQASWSNQSMLYCGDCHGTSRALAAAGPHASTESPLLGRPFIGAAPGDQNLLCYMCHKPGVYLTGAIDGAGGSTSNFYKTDGTAAQRPQHYRHVGMRGYGCRTCHVSHGSTLKANLINDEVGWVPQAAGGTCTNSCHGGASNQYTGP